MKNFLKIFMKNFFKKFFYKNFLTKIFFTSSGTPKFRDEDSDGTPKVLNMSPNDTDASLMIAMQSQSFLD